ncbi:MAG: fimbria major subunit [Tannerella sp.]|jgi:hypothetical protein|nr:fimbria major subunit [Tannerella sp.]
MKKKVLSLGLLGVTLLGCTDSIVNTGVVPEKDVDDISYATFFLNPVGGFNSTYGGLSEVEGSGNENTISDAFIAIYKTDGEPEALAYLAAVPMYTNAATGSGGKITIKCRTGVKKIYVATNVGNPVSVKPTGNTSSILIYGNTDKQVQNTEVDPGIAESYEGAEGTSFADTVNALIVSTGGTTYINDFNNTSLVTTGTPSLPTAGASADGLILALTGRGNTSNGVLTGNGSQNSMSAFLMTNWDGNDDNAGLNTNSSTCTFLVRMVSPAESRSATPSDLFKNAFVINLQRAVAKIALSVNPNALASAGSGTNKGQVDLQLGNSSIYTNPKFAVGNIAKATYPFQQFDGNIVKSAAYDFREGIYENESLGLMQWRRFMDNSRIYGAYDLTGYPGSRTTVDAVVATINSSPNIAYRQQATPSFGVDDYVIIPENNNKETFAFYSTYVVFAAKYNPDRIITAVNDVGATTIVAGSNTVPAYTSNGTATDTLYYLKNREEGYFFWGLNTLVDYLKYRERVSLSDAEMEQLLAAWEYLGELQKYYQGICFYRIWVQDNEAVEAANMVLVRRNHFYNIIVDSFAGPGIANPHEIVSKYKVVTPICCDTSPTFITVSIRVAPWHVVEQRETADDTVW